MTQADLFDIEAGDQAKEAGIANAQAGAPVDWLGNAMAAVRQVCREAETFTTDDVWLALETAGVDSSEVETRALGAIMKRACAIGLCYKATDLPHRLSVRKACHRRPLQVWRSKQNS